MRKAVLFVVLIALITMMVGSLTASANTGDNNYTIFPTLQMTPQIIMYPHVKDKYGCMHIRNIPGRYWCIYYLPILQNR